MIWELNALKHLEAMVDITTRCNAGCPQCHRTNPLGLKKTDWLPDINWSLKQFKQALPGHIIKHMKIIDFCGTWGDAVVNNDLLSMIKYIKKENPECIICINTNGSLRNEQFWWDLGVAGGKNLQVVFCVEGTTQEMHENYRQFTFLDKILANMDILSNTPATIRTQTLVWKHNEHCLPEIEKLCMDHGSLRHHFVATDRWHDVDKLEFSIKGKPGVLEATSPDWQRKFRQTHQEKKEAENRPDYVRIDRRRFTTQTKKVSNTDKEFMKNLSKQSKTNKNNIACEWGNHNKVVINPDGQVLPCCYFCNPHFLNKHDPKIRIEFIDHPIMKEYKIYEKELNVFTNDLKNIINHKWYTEILPDSWRSDNPVRQCSKYCKNCAL